MTLPEYMKTGALVSVESWFDNRRYIGSIAYLNDSYIGLDYLIIDGEMCVPVEEVHWTQVYSPNKIALEKAYTSCIEKYHYDIKHNQYVDCISIETNSGSATYDVDTPDALKACIYHFLEKNEGKPLSFNELSWKISRKLVIDTDVVRTRLNGITLPSEIIERIDLNGNKTYEIESTTESHGFKTRAQLSEEKSKIRYGVCPNCGSTLIPRYGRYGRFYGCSNYPNCRYYKKIRKI